jgi:hypothetical protein
VGLYRFNTENAQRFADVPHEPCIYVAELSSGVIKVGVGGSARARMMAFANEAKRVHGAELLRFHVVAKPNTKAAYETESVVVALLVQIGSLVPGRREYFTGVAYEFVRDLVEAVKGAAYKRNRIRTVRPLYGAHLPRQQSA